MPFQIDVAELSGLVVEAGFYGMYLTLFIVAAYIFARRHARQVATLSLPMASTAVCMILLATAQLAVDTANVFAAFLHRTREERIAFLADTGTGLFSAKHCILITQLLIGDSFVSYRCWVVWGRRVWIVVLPVLLSLGSAISGAYVMWVFAHHASTTLKEVKSWVAAIFTLSLCANAVATSLLAFRIWQVNRRTRTALLGTAATSATGSTLMPLVKILLESGAINVAYLVICNATLLSGSEAIEFMAQVSTSISGIVFCIVIIRVGLNTRGELDWTGGHRTADIRFAAGPAPNTKAGASAISGMEAGALGTMRTVDVNIQRSFQVSRGSGLGSDVDADIEMKDAFANARDI